MDMNRIYSEMTADAARAYHAANTESQSGASRTCESCEGSGSAGTVECYDCDGTGMVVDQGPLVCARPDPTRAVANSETTDAMTAPKGHWPKGRSRNLDASRVSQGKTLAALLCQAVEAGYSHPVHGALTYAGVAAILDVDRGTVWKWATGKRLPPQRLLEHLRRLLHGFRPE